MKRFDSLAIYFPFSFSLSASLLALAGCGTSVIGGGDTTGGGFPGGTGGAGGSALVTTVATSSSGAGGSAPVTTVTSTGAGGSACPGEPPLSGACAPAALCASTISGSTCLAHVNQAASPTPGFRMSQIQFTKPAAFAMGLVNGVLSNAANPDDPACNLAGAGTFSWLLRFDLAAGSLTTGGAKPSSNPAGPYAFVDEFVTQGSTSYHIQPTTLSGPLGTDCTFASSPGDVLLPVYLDAGATQSLLLPLRALRFQSATMSADHGCIGRYNAAALTPANGCLADSENPAFTDTGAAVAHMVLEEADQTIISTLNQSLCVLLSQDPATYGMKNAAGVTVCKRDASSKILFKGDWCGASNGAATSVCADAVRVALDFAAQAVHIL